MHLVEVDPVGLEPLQAVLDLLHDPAPRVVAVVRVAGLTHRYVHRAVEFRCQDDVVTTTARQRFADDDLGLSLGVDVGGVDEVMAVVECPVDDRHRRVEVPHQVRRGVTVQIGPTGFHPPSLARTRRFVRGRTIGAWFRST